MQRKSSRVPPSRGDAADIRDAMDAIRRVVQALRTGAPESGVSTAQLFALQQIAQHPGSSINDLAALTYTHQSSVSVVVRRLVEQRLVAKVTSRDDRRRQSLALTARGRRLLGRAPAAVQERLIAALARLSRTECRRLTKSLSVVARSVAPDAGGEAPPMLFEEPDQDG
jgi:DNA-binding MarR family transcriptional regulator